jgi:hypothetical protein
MLNNCSRRTIMFRLLKNIEILEKSIFLINFRNLTAMADIIKKEKMINKIKTNKM